MPIFAINFFSIFLWALIVHFMPMSDKKKKLVFLGIVFIQFTLLAWQREFTVGQDTMQYYLVFRDVSKISLEKALTLKWEPGYILWNWGISHLGFDFHNYLLFTAIFIYLPICRFIYRYSACTWLSVVIFIALGFFFGSLHILRQYMAIALVLFSYDYLLQRRLIPFIVLVLLAATFHTSAIVFLPTYFICSRKMNSATMILIFLLSLTLAFTAGDLLLRFTVISEKYATAYLKDADTGKGYGMLLFLCAIMIVAMLLKPQNLSGRANAFYWIFFIALCFQPFATIVSMVSRSILYWLLSITVLLPLIISQIKNRDLRLISYAVVSIGLILFFELLSNTSEGIEVYATYEFYTNQ